MPLDNTLRLLTEQHTAVVAAAAEALLTADDATEDAWSVESRQFWHDILLTASFVLMVVCPFLLTVANRVRNVSRELELNLSCCTSTRSEKTLSWLARLLECAEKIDEFSGVDFDLAYREGVDPQTIGASAVVTQAFRRFCYGLADERDKDILKRYLTPQLQPQPEPEPRAALCSAPTFRLGQMAVAATSDPRDPDDNGGGLPPPPDDDGGEDQLGPALSWSPSSPTAQPQPQLSSPRWRSPALGNTRGSLHLGGTEASNGGRLVRMAMAATSGPTGLRTLSRLPPLPTSEEVVAVRSQRSRATAEAQLQTRSPLRSRPSPRLGNARPTDRSAAEGPAAPARYDYGGGLNRLDPGYGRDRGGGRGRGVRPSTPPRNP